MKKGVIVVAALLCILASSAAEAEEPLRFNFGVFPVGLMISPDVDGFRASSGGWSEEISGSSLYAPGVFAGVDYDTNASGVGVDVFGSGLISGALTGSVIGANVSYILPHSAEGIFRPRIKGGVIRGTLEWEGDHTDVEFDDATGWQAGVGFDIGRPRWKFSIYGEVLYRNLEFDVKTSSGTTANRSTLDMTGGVVNVGMKFSF